MKSILEKYAALLVNYCLEVKATDKVYIRSTTLGEPLVREVYRLAMRKGAIVEVGFEMRSHNSIFFQEAQNDRQLTYVPIQYKNAIENFDAYLYIRAPYNTREDQSIDQAKLKKRQSAHTAIQKTYFDRTGSKALRRSLCQFPTQANAQEAGMGLEEYEDFIYNACNLFSDDPAAEWLKVRREQQTIVDYLNQCQRIHYKGENVDVSFSCEGRTWINSDGTTNMPSGEVYTSPVEDSVNGHVHFSLPATYQGNTVEGATLWVKDGYIEKWEAKAGKAFLDYIFSLKGTRRFGEAAVGTNYNINKITRNILFDEKIGGTVHLAIGQSYNQCGGKNVSPIHWDMITEMHNGGMIFADGEKIYENGKFLIG